MQQVWNEYKEIVQSNKDDRFSHLTCDGVQDRVQFVRVDNVWDINDPTLRQVVETGCDCLMHTAGPFLDREPTPLRLAVECQCPVYIDVSDPIPFLEKSLLESSKAVESGTTALLAAGAFPGMSNVLAMEASSQLPESTPVQDVRFAYYTAGLGGSGPLNLYITNLGFGEPMVQYDQGTVRPYEALSGRLLGNVDFFLPRQSPSGFGNADARSRIGTRQVFAWPFPEAATVPAELQAQGNSWACMGTAPELWNVMLGILVEFLPRPWWRNARFSKFMADFSQPLVWMTDQILKWTDVNQVGETHAMRIDVTVAHSTSTMDENGHKGQPGISMVQAHDSFRQCVGQSCAEFALDCLLYPNAGVRLPEQRYRDNQERSRIIQALTSTPGTFCFTGPVPHQCIAAPTGIVQALSEANRAEETMAR